MKPRISYAFVHEGTRHDFSHAFADIMQPSYLSHHPFSSYWCVCWPLHCWKILASFSSFSYRACHIISPWFFVHACKAHNDQVHECLVAVWTLKTWKEIKTPVLGWYHCLLIAGWWRQHNFKDRFLLTSLAFPICRLCKSQLQAVQRKLAYSFIRFTQNGFR